MTLQRTANERAFHDRINDNTDGLAALKDLNWEGGKEFPVPPRAVIEFTSLAKSSNPRIRDLSAIVESEPGLTAELLRSVNSSVYGFRSRVESVPQAIALIGISSCTSIFLTKALDHAMKYFESPLISNTVIRYESLERARFARETAQRMGLDPVLSFTASTLQDILLPMLTSRYESEYADYLSSDRFPDIATFEREKFGWTHAEVTAKTLQEWGFPESLVIRVLMHHDSPEEMLLREGPPHDAVPNAIAALLEDRLKQSPCGVSRLVDLQRFHPAIQPLEIAECVDDQRSSTQRLPGIRCLVERIQDGMLGQVERRRRDSITAGRQFGNYVLEKKLTESAMGTIYRAKHIVLRRHAAIKFLRSDRMSEENIQQFEKEVCVTSTLHHPNTISIFDYGHTHDGLFYYAMELVNGLTLDRLVNNRGPVPDGRVLQILMQVCGSLAEAHASGLVHRDIKPQNLMVSEAVGSGDKMTVLDFGLVSEAKSSESVIRGTPHFISPEAVLRSDGIDGRSDIYSLAAVAYFLLTGEHMFDGPVTSVMSQHLENHPTRLSMRTSNAIASEFEDVLMRCLSKKPEDRPQSCMDLLEELAYCQPAHEWLIEDSHQWWQQYGSCAIERTPLARCACEDTVIAPKLDHRELCEVS